MKVFFFLNYFLYNSIVSTSGKGETGSPHIEDQVMPLSHKALGSIIKVLLQFTI